MKRLLCALLCLWACPVLAAEITGRINLNGATGDAVRAGYVGLSAAGKQIDCFAGLTVGESSASAWCDTYKPRRSAVAWNPKTGCTFSHTSLPAGRYVVYARWGELYYDWKIVKVPSSSSRVKADLDLDLSRAGDMRIVLPPGASDYNIRLTPLDSASKLPLAGVDLQMYMSASIDARPGSNDLRTLKPGKYRMEVNTAQRQGSDSDGWFAVYNPVGAWSVDVKANQCLVYRPPVRVE